MLQSQPNSQQYTEVPATFAWMRNFGNFIQSLTEHRSSKDLFKHLEARTRTFIKIYGTEQQRNFVQALKETKLRTGVILLVLINDIVSDNPDGQVLKLCQRGRGFKGWYPKFQQRISEDGTKAKLQRLLPPGGILSKSDPDEDEKVKIAKIPEEDFSTLRSLQKPIVVTPPDLEDAFVGLEASLKQALNLYHFIRGLGLTVRSDYKDTPSFGSMSVRQVEESAQLLVKKNLTGKHNQLKAKFIEMVLLSSSWILVNSPAEFG